MLDRPPKVLAQRRRQARYTRRQRAGRAVYPVELGADDLDILVDCGVLPEARAGDRAAVGRAIAAALTELAQWQRNGDASALGRRKQ
jgi:hypothetical protein